MKLLYTLILATSGLNVFESENRLPLLASEGKGPSGLWRLFGLRHANRNVVIPARDLTRDKLIDLSIDGWLYKNGKLKWYVEEVWETKGDGNGLVQKTDHGVCNVIPGPEMYAMGQREAAIPIQVAMSVDGGKEVPVTV